MSDAIAPEPAVVPPKRSRLATILRWSARGTSLPVLALVLVSLVPAVTTLAVAAPDDRIMAGALMGTCLGLLAGWRWPGLGGALILASVAVMFATGDGSPDPFSVGFGLQGILFLLSWASNHASAASCAPGLGWPRRVAIGLLGCGAILGVAMIYRGPGPTPVPRDKESFVGCWTNGTGFKLEIAPEGRVSIAREKDAKIQPWNTPVGPGAAASFNLTFRGDERLELSSGAFGAAIAYHVDRPPHQRGKEVMMVLNASDPYQRQAGIRLVKQVDAGTKAAIKDGKTRK